MTAIDFIDLHVNLAQQMLESVSEDNNDNVYFTFGRVTGWANASNPPVANTQPVTYQEIWRNMIGAKRITGSNVSLGIRRRDWTANTVYDEYDQTNPNLFLSNTKFYVLTSDWNVYKCIHNNNSANSTIEPTAINANNVTNTADGYVWKYMYTVPTSDRLKFLTDNYIPIQQLTTDNFSLQWDVQAAAVEGAIYAAKVTSGGSGYSNTSNVSIAFSGDGDDAAATVTLNTSTNTVNTIVMTNYGTGYSYATATISGGGGSGATVVPLLSPQGGHGSEPIYELGASFLIINMRLEGSEGGLFSTANEFRQTSLIKNPKEHGSSNIASNTVISQTTDITVSGSGVDYTEDEQVYQGSSLSAATFTARVLEYDSANSLLKLVDTVGTPTNDLLIGANTTAAKFVASVDNPGFTRLTGRLLYVNNIEAIARDPDQTEDFKIVIGL